MNMEKTRHPGIYRRGGRYVAIASYRHPSGKQRQKWITRRTLRAALDARRDFLNDLDRGIRPDGGRLTVAEFLEQHWLPEIEATRRPLTVEKYRSVVRRHILPSLGAVRLRDLGRDHLRGLYRALPTPSLARFTHSVLSSALSYAVKDRGLLGVNPCASIRPPKIDRPEARYLGDTEARRMVAEARGDRLEAAITLGLLAGLRRGEVCAITWGDLDLEAGTLIVRGSYWGPTKSGRIRGLALPTPAVHALKRGRKRQAQELLAVGVRQTDETPVLARFDGGQVTPLGLGKMFRRFCEEHGFPGLTFHALRHSNASLLLAAGTDVKTVATRLGHANPSLLFTTYSHVIEAADRTAADRLGQAFA